VRAMALILLIVGSRLLSAAPCLADEAPSLLVQGIRARDHALETNSPADWQLALSSFELAVEQDASKEAMFELANAAVRLDLLDQAFQAYERALKMNINPRAETDARALIETHAH
jgi:hypothetical protein